MMRTLYINKDGVLKIKNTTIYFISKDEKTPIPIERLDSIYFIGSGSISTGVLKRLSKNGILLHVFNKYGIYLGTYYPKKQRLSGEIIVRQVKAYLDNKYRLRLAKAFVEGAYSNIKRILNRHNIEQIKDYSINAKDIPTLMQQEGTVRKMFYKKIDEIVNPEFRIGSREIRPPSNRANAIISFLNSMVYTKVATEVYHTHLNPTISYLHEPFQRRYSLALDIAEIFKPILSENLFLRMVNKKMLDPNIDFIDAKGVFLSKIGRKKVMKAFEEEIKKAIKMRTSNKKRTIQELIRVELYKLEKDLLGISQYKPLKMWW